jgi:hypothetical protein
MASLQFDKTHISHSGLQSHVGSDFFPPFYNPCLSSSNHSDLYSISGATQAHSCHGDFALCSPSWSGILPDFTLPPPSHSPPHRGVGYLASHPLSFYLTTLFIFFTEFVTLVVETQCYLNP